MRAFRMALVIAALAVGVSKEASAESIEAGEAAELLTGRTWSGDNPDGSSFGFYHGADGSFRARITSASAGTKVYGGRLQMRGSGDLIGTAQSGLPSFRIADLERQAGLMAIAQTDARKLLVDDPTLEGPRGRAARTLLWLMSQEEAIRLISVG